MWPMNMGPEEESINIPTQNTDCKIVGNRKSLVGLLGMEQ